MERNPWKLATIGLALVGTTALGTGLTTAYVLRSPADAPETAEAPRAVTVPRPLGTRACGDASGGIAGRPARDAGGNDAGGHGGVHGR